MVLPDYFKVKNAWITPGIHPIKVSNTFSQNEPVKPF
jgi:hypothetical protein